MAKEEGLELDSESETERVDLVGHTKKWAIYYSIMRVMHRCTCTETEKCTLMIISSVGEKRGSKTN